MSSGLTHIGAIARGLAYPPSPSPRAQAPAPPRAEPIEEVEAAKAVQPCESPVEARERLREQVMAERGVDLFDLYRMGSQERIRAETEIRVETSLRASHARSRATGSLLDLRV